MRFKINKSDDGQYFYTVHGGNHACMLVSETMKSKQSVKNAIAKIIEGAADAEILDETL